MNDRRNPDLPEEPEEEDRPPGVGEEPGMAGREPERTDARAQYAQESEFPVERDIEDELPTETPLPDSTDIDRDSESLPYRGQTTEIDQPYQSQGMPIQQSGLHGEVPADENPLQPQAPAEPTTTGTGQAPATRGDKTVWLLIVIAAIVFCVVVLALVIGGVFA
jgi:hypothetical protein